jgi:hypothetical protein
MPKLEEIPPDVLEYLQATVYSKSEICFHWFKRRMSIEWGELYNKDIGHPLFPLSRPSAIEVGENK